MGEWYVPGRVDLRFLDGDDGTVLAAECQSVLDPRVVAVGHPLQTGSWGFKLRLRALGYDIQPWLPAPPTPSAAALVDGVPLVAHADRHGRLTLDVGHLRRTVIGSARPRPEDASVRRERADAVLAVELPRLHVSGTSELPAELHLTPVTEPGHGSPLDERSSPRVDAVRGRLIADAMGARLTGRVVLRRRGRYRMRARVGSRETSPLLDLVVTRTAKVTFLKVGAPERARERLADRLTGSLLRRLRAR